MLATKSTGGQINKCWYNHTLEYSGAIKKYDEKVYFLKRWGGKSRLYNSSQGMQKIIYVPREKKPKKAQATC